MALLARRALLNPGLPHPLLPVYIVTIGEVRTVVTAAALLPPERGTGDQSAHRQDACRPPVFRIERLIVLESSVEILPAGFESRQRARQAVAIPEEADVLPHDPRQLDRISFQSSDVFARERGPRGGHGLVARCCFQPHRPACSRAKDQSFEQRVAGQSVGTMNTGARHLTRGEQARNGRTSIQIGPHSSHDVVRRGTDGNAIARKIQPRASARLGNEREPRVDEVGIELRQRQVHRLARSTALADDRPRDAIARR